ncbi:MAG: hypothetical protein WAM92_08065 [Mycobacterium sp.]
MAGVADKDAALADAFNIKSVRQFGSSKFFRLAATLLALEDAS